MALVRNWHFAVLIASLVLVVLSSGVVPAGGVTVTKIAVVAGDATGGISSIASNGAQKLIEDSFGKTIAVYVDGVGKIGVTYANSNPTIASSWALPVKSPGALFGYRRPAAVLVSSSSLRIIAEDGTGVGHINDLPVTITRDSQNNIIGLSFGTRVSLDTSGGAHYPSAVLAHNGDILAVWWQNATTSSNVKAFRWRPGVGWRGFSGATTVPDDAILDTSNLKAIFPNIIQRGDNRNVYLLGNREENSAQTNLLFNKATFGGTNWSWGAQNLAYETNSARGLFDTPSLVWDPIRQLVVAAYDISTQERYAVFTLSSSDVKTHFDTQTISIANNEWGNIEVFEPTGDYYLFMIDSVDPVANHDNGRIGYIRYDGTSWETSLTIVDSDTNNVGINMRRTGSTTSMDFLYADTVGGTPSQLKFVRIFQAENVSTQAYTPIEDALVNASAANTNFGSYARLEVDSSPAIKHSLLKFQLTGLTGHLIIEAKLRLFCVGSSVKGGDFYKTSDAWSESTVTWNNAPAADPGLIASLGSVSTSAWVEVDVTSIVTSSGPLNLKVLPASSDGADYSSKEGANPPQLIITYSNRAPELSPIGNKNTNEETLLTVTATATDPDNDPLTFSLGPGAPLGASITSAGAFSWTPAENQGPNTYQVTIIVSDSNLADNETITITVNEANKPPSLTLPGAQTASEGSILTFTVTATDTDIPANTVTLSASGLPTGAVFDPATGVFSWTPSEAQGPGDYTVTFTATDNGSPPLSNTSSVAVHVNELNSSPSLSVPGAQTINELQPLAFTVSATDPDLPANTLTLACTNCAAIAATFNAATGQFSWSPTEAQGPGDYMISFTATDNGTPTLSDTMTVGIHVNEVNQPPTLSVPGAQTVQEGSTLSFSITAADLDVPSNLVSLSASGLPAGASFNQSTGTFSWTPSLGQQGTYTVTFTATDDGSPQLSDPKNVTITVTAAILVADFSFSAATTGKPVNFKATASGGTLPYAFFWDFGDGSTASAQSVSHSYSVKGSYNATLIVTDSLNRTSIVSHLVTVSAQSMAVTISASAVSSGKPADFTAAVTGGTAPYVVAWSFGDGSTGSGNPTVHVYNVKGSYTVNATVVDANGVSAAASILVNVAQQPLTVSITASASATSGKPVSFTSTITGGTSPYTVSWSFGDGTTASGATTEHAYTVKGAYTVALMVTDANGATANATISLVVQPQPLVGEFASSPATSGKPTSFSTIVSGGTSPYIFNWNFGDGSLVETGASVSHVYAVKGTYNVGLVVLDSNNATATISGLVNVAPQSITVSVGVSGTAVGEPVGFAASASGGTAPYTIAWQFGDGSTASGSSVSHAYAVKGTYTWTVNVTDANGASSVASGTVTIDPQPLTITASCDPATSGKPVSCTTLASGGTAPYAFSWDIGNDTVIDGSGSTFAMTFAVKGSYLIVVRVTDSNNASSTTSPVVVVQPQPLTVDFVVSSASLTTNKPASFDATASGGTSPYSFSWNFGDNSTSSSSSVSHAYATKGSYNVTLTVTDANGATVAVFRLVSVNPQPLVITASCGSATAGKPVTCSASASGGTSPYSFAWDVGKDGLVDGSGASFTASFPVKGSYSIDAVVVDTNNALSSVNMAILVAPQPLAVNVTFDPSVPTAGKPITFGATVSGGTVPYLFSWNFGDQSSQTGNPASHTYSTKGTYNATLTVTDANSATAAIVRIVTVAGQALTVSASCDQGTSGKPVGCTASAVGGTSPYLFSWDAVKDGTVDGTGQAFITTFPVKGTHSVDVSATDANGETASTNVPVTVAPQLLAADFAVSSPRLVGQPVDFSATASGGTAPYTFAWDFGKDGSVDGTGPSFTHVFSVKGSQSIDVAVSDANGAVASINLVIVVDPHPLTVTGQCSQGNAGKPISCSATGSGGTQPYVFGWDVGKDGSFEGTGSNFTWTFPTKGSYSVDAVVVDANGVTANVNVSVTVAPQPLTASLTVTTQPAGQPTTFAASISGGTVPYTVFWDFADGTNTTGNPASHVYAVKGSYNVTLVVTDANANTTLLRVLVNITPRPLGITAECSNASAGKPVDCGSSVSGGTSPFSISWTFSDGGTTSESSVSHVFAVKGMYTVTVNVTDANLASATTIFQVLVASQPLQTDITAAPSSPTVGKPATFSASPSGGTTPYAFLWAFGDGSTDTGGSVTHTYNVKGTYNVTLVVTDANNSTASVGRTVMVNPRPLVVTAHCSNGTAGKPVDCDASAFGGTLPYLFSWDVSKDGTIDGTGVPYSVTFPVKGTYSIDSIVTDANGDVSSLNLIVTIQPQPLTLDISTSSEVTTGKPVSFASTVIGGTSPYTVSWSFGDGNTASGTTITHIYAGKGTYGVTANVTDANGIVANATTTVTVQAQPLVAEFTSSVATAGKPVGFNATVNGGTSPYFFSWSFGDSSVGSGSSVTHTYAVKGSYNVTLTVADSNGATATLTRLVSVNPQPLAISASCENGTTGKPVTCSASASGGTSPYSFAWDVGKDGVMDGTGSSFSSSFPVKGSYSIDAVVTDSNNSTALVNLVVLIDPQPLTAVVTIEPSGPTAGKPVAFSATAAGGTGPYLFSWDFGDLSGGTGQAVSHIYTVKGSYNVLARITDANSANTTTTAVLLVTPQALVIAVSCDQATAGKPFACNATASGGTLPYLFSWDIGKDGSIDGQGPDLITVFSVNGTYSIDAIVIDANNASASVNLPISVSSQPLVITATCNAGSAGKPTSCIASASGGTPPYIFLWDVGKDGTIDGQGSGFTASFPVKGTYSVDAIVIDANNSAASVNLSITVTAQPVIITASCFPGTAGKPTTCVASASGGTAPYRFLWDIGKDGTIDGVEANFTTVFPVKGSYSIDAIAIDANNATAFVNLSIVVGPQPLVITASCQPGTAGKPTSCVASATGGTPPYGFLWDLGKDGTVDGSGSSFVTVFPVKGTYSLDAIVVDANNATAFVNLSFSINPQPLVITASCEAGTAGKPTQCSASSTGGTTPYTFIWDVGKDGTVDGQGSGFTASFPVKGTYSIDAKVVDANNVTASVNLSLGISSQPLAITASCNPGTAGKPTSCDASASGGTAPYRFLWNVGKDDTVDGVDSGFVTVFAVKGTYSIDAIVIDANNATESLNLPVVVGGQPLVITAGCQPGNAGKPTSCDASASGGTTPYTFEWDVGRDEIVDGSGSSFVTSFAVKGGYSVDAIVRDANNATDFVTLSFSVNPQPLVITASCNPGTAGKPTSCDASASGGTTPYIFLWDVGKDGTVDGQGSGFTTVFIVKGSYSIDAIVIDVNNATAFVNLPVAVRPQPLVITAACQPGTAGKPTTCSASASGGTTPYTFLWDIGNDGTIDGTGPDMVTIFTVKGSYIIDAIVADSNNATALVGQPMVVGPQPLIITASCNPGTAGKPTSCSASASGGTTPYSFVWDVGKDGTIDGQGQDFVTVFPVKGAYGIDSTVIDANSATAFVNLSFEVTPQPLIITASCAPGTAGKPVSCDASATGGTTPYTFLWDVGKDGAIDGTGSGFVTSFAVKGSYSIDAIVVDANNSTALVNLSVVVGPQALMISASCQPGTAGQPTLCGASASGGTIPYRFLWDVGKDGTIDGVGANFITIFPVGGTYSIDAIAADANGALASVNLPVIVRSPLLVEPSLSAHRVGETFNVAVNILNVADLYAYDLYLNYNTSILDIQAVECEQGTLLQSVPHFTIACTFNDATGEARAAVSRLGSTSGGGSGTLFTVTFSVTGITNSLAVLDINRVNLVDSSFAPVPTQVTDGAFYTDLPPVASPFTITPQGSEIHLLARRPLVFDASSSYDPDSAYDPAGQVALGCAWDFGDSSPASYNCLETHTYSTGRTYLVTLTLTDNEGSVDILQTIIVRNSPDLDSSGCVTIVDVAMIAYRWGSVLGDSLYDPSFDMDNDGDVDIVDVAFIARDFDTCGWT